MTTDEVSKTLPEDLVEQIIASMPFPSIFKARCLSKSWQARFEPVSSLHEEESKRLATSFQNQVAKWSNEWNTFFQIHTFRGTDGKEDCVGFDRTLQKQQLLPSLRFLREVFYLGDDLDFGGDVCHDAKSNTKSNLQIEGPLLFGAVDINTHKEELYVANLLTQKWKRVPPRPHSFENVVYVTKLVVEPTSPTYKLILFCCARRGLVASFYHCPVQMYDSKSGTWSGELDFQIGPKDFPCTSAYVKGVLYVFTKLETHLLAFNLEEGTLTRHLLSGIHASGRLVVCNDTVFFIAIEREYVRVLEVDLGTGAVWEVVRCPNSGFKLIPLNGCIEAGVRIDGSIDLEIGDIIDGQMLDCFCFHTENVSDLMVVYSQRKNKWAFLSFTGMPRGSKDISFQPGLNTFMTV